MARNQGIINRVRRDFELGLDITDDEIWKGVENTFTEVAYTLDMAKQDVKKAVLNLCYENKIAGKIISRLTRANRLT
jgi:hypothetical protein